MSSYGESQRSLFFDFPHQTQPLSLSRVNAVVVGKDLSMPRPLTEWRVLSHGALTKITDNILTVVGDISMPAGKIARRMTVVRLRDGRLVVFSAIALHEKEMRELENFGKLAFLIVPNGHHRLDSKIWKKRYPEIKVITPQGAREAVEKIVPVDAVKADFNDPNVVFIVVPGTGEREAALEVKGDNGATLILNDLVGNLRNTRGFGGWFLRMMGFAGNKPQVPVPVKLTMIKDKHAFAKQLMQWAELPALRRILVSHGSTIEDNPRGVLRELAASLQ